MRITTAHSYATAVDNLQQRQQELQRAQTQLTSGKRVARASDDPTAAARVERALATHSRAVANQRGMEASRNAMQQAEGALGNATEAMQQVRELLVAAGNATYSDAERANFGARIAGLREQLLAIANRGDGAGGYLFGGQGSAQPPFVDGTPSVTFAGVAGVTTVQAGELLPMTQDGAAAWLNARSGNGVFVTAADPANLGNGAWIDAGSVTDPGQLIYGNYRIVFGASADVTVTLVPPVGAPVLVLQQPYVDGQAIEFDGMAVTVKGTPSAGDAFDVTPAAPDLSLFDVLDRVASELHTGGRSTAQVAQTVASGLRDVDQVLGNLQMQRSLAGESLNHIDSVEGRLSEIQLEAKTQRSLAEDLDMVQALSDFQAKQTGYEAALSTYSLVQRMSLFQYLK